MQSRYALVLISLNPDKTDLSGNKYPESGYIEATSYKPDQDIRHGLYGTLWGKTTSTKWLNMDEKAYWTVARCEKNDDLIALDPRQNFFKFRAAMVVFNGNLETCSDYISKHLPPEGISWVLARQESLLREAELV